MSGGDGSRTSGDAADVAFGSSGEEIASQLAEFESKELAQVERAIRRLKQGSYGKCEACDGRIPVARLNALPYSTMCISCQRTTESEGGLAGGHGEFDWARVSDGRNPMDERDVNLSQIELDMSR